MTIGIEALRLHLDIAIVFEAADPQRSRPPTIGTSLELHPPG